jgi:DNA-binding transcriptional MerR regulator
MPDEPYTLGDLASLADVTPRTIRYYVAQGLLPSPEAAGPATRYGETHLARLRLIKRLQRDHLPLAEIRARLDRMGDDEIALLAAQGPAPAEPAAPEETLRYVRTLMAQTGIRPNAEAPAAAPPRGTLMKRVAEFRPITPDSYPLRDTPEPGPGQAPQPAMPPMPSMAPPVPVAPGPRTVPDRSTWERVALTPDVEIHVRRPLDRLVNKRVEQLLRIARELFDQEP